MAGIVPESLLEWGLGTGGDHAPRPPEADTLAVPDAVTTNSRKAQQKLGKLVNQGRHAAHIASLDQLPENARPPAPDEPLGQRETNAFAKARQELTRGRSHRMPPGAANVLAPCHTGIRTIIRGNWKAIQGDWGTHGSEVPLLRCS